MDQPCNSPGLMGWFCGEGTWPLSEYSFLAFMLEGREEGEGTNVSWKLHTSLLLTAPKPDLIHVAITRCDGRL